MALVTKDDVKAFLKLDSGTAEDTMLDHLIAAATAEMEQIHNRIYEYGTYIETFNGGEVFLFLKAYPVKTITSVTVDGTTLSSDDYKLDSQRGLLQGPWTKGLSNIQVQYDGGFWTDPNTQPPAGVPSLPADLKHECLERVAFLYENRGGYR